ncbi:MAG: endonuclease III [Zestosphaera sp.]
MLEDDSFIPTKARKASLSPLESLIGIILSQNSTDKNAWKALENLIKYYGGRVTAEKISSTDLRVLESLIKPAGIYRSKARAIKNLVLVLREEELTSLDASKLKEKLALVRGVGPKTIDVFLASVRGVPTFPIDTHIRRILYRLGVIDKRIEKYEKIRSVVMSQVPPDKLLTTHYVLIIHGRTTCKARKPRCAECPVEDLCEKRGVSFC